MDSFPSFHHGDSPEFPAQLRDRVFMDRLRSERPDLYARISERFPQMFTPTFPETFGESFRDIPIHHANIPSAHFQHPSEHFPMDGSERHFYQAQSPPQQQQQQPTVNGASEHQPRVYNIPIRVEGQDTNNSSTPSPTPVAQHQPTEQHNVTNQNNRQHESKPVNEAPPPPSNPHPSTPPRPMKNGPGRAIPIQVIKTSNSAASAQPAPRTVKPEPQVTTNVVEDEQVLADPNKVIALGYTEQPEAAGAQAEVKDEVMDEPNKMEDVKQTKAAETSFDHVKEVLDDLQNYRAQVNEFGGNDVQDKGYKWLDEMLTLCVLRLDCVQINGDEQLRKYRKEAINQVNEVSAILESKVSKKRGGEEIKEDKTPNDKEAEVKAPETKSKVIKIKKKKDKEDAKKEEEQGGEEKEKKKFFGFGKSKSKKKAGDGLDPNNNVKAEDGESSVSSQRTSDSTSSSTTTLQGRETAV